MTDQILERVSTWILWHFSSCFPPQLCCLDLQSPFCHTGQTSPCWGKPGSQVSQNQSEYNDDYLWLHEGPHPHLDVHDAGVPEVRQAAAQLHVLCRKVIWLSATTMIAYFPPLSPLSGRTWAPPAWGCLSSAPCNTAPPGYCTSSEQCPAHSRYVVCSDKYAWVHGCMYVCVCERAWVCVSICV